MAYLVRVSDHNFDPEVLKCDIPVLACYLAEWSADVEDAGVMLAEIASDYVEQLKVVQLAVEANPDSVSGYGVLTTPTLILFKNGQEVARFTGVVSKAGILEKIKPFLDK
jgi:thioredoxin 1